MPGDLPPEKFSEQLENGQLFPFYLFYGENEFLLERVLSRVRQALIPEEAGDFDLQIYYGGKGEKVHPAEMIDTARTLPFLSHKRLVIVRRTDDIPTAALEGFITYLDDPAESTCLICVSSKADFRKGFYKKIRGLGRAVNFRNLYDNQVMPWIMRMAKDLGLNIEKEACAYLQQIVGNRLMDLSSELEKLYACYGETPVGLEEAKALAIHSRAYTIFELMDQVSFKRGAQSISVLQRFLEMGDAQSSLGLLGMLIRQVRILWQTKSVIEGGGHASQVAGKAGVPSYLVDKLVRQARLWGRDDLEQAFEILYRADGLIKSGSQPYLVLENVVISLCR